MNYINDHILPREFSYPKKVRALICCDLDETYIPFAHGDRVRGGISELERFMCEEGVAKGLLLGWVTGTNLISALRKANGYISRSPNFISCSLGSEFYWVVDGKLKPSLAWSERIKKSGYTKKGINSLLETLSNKGIHLIKQPEDYQGCYKDSFYYKISYSMEKDFEFIRILSKHFLIRVIISKSNPSAGDPEDCYDVDFIPLCCGKDEAVTFLLKEMRVDRLKVYAFGDSCNDFPMFSKAGHSYLVKNADPAAIVLHGNCLKLPYCHGIVSVLKDI